MQRKEKGFRLESNSKREVKSLDEAIQDQASYNEIFG
ncbi:uncharacterized protein METZ01_LOCUS418328, partial [marine metagenome]